MSKANKTNHKGFTFPFFRKKQEEPKDLFQEELVLSPTRMAINNFKSNRMAMVSLILFLFIFLSCFILPYFLPMDIRHTNPTIQNIPPTMSLQKFPDEMKKNPKQVAVGSSFSLGIDSNGKLHIWGYSPEKMMKLPKGLTKQKFVSVAAGMDHAVALDETGKIWTWGNDEFHLSEIPVEAEYEKPHAVYANYLYSIFLSEEGLGFKWGNEFTAAVDMELAEEPIVDIFTNMDTALALTESHHLVSLSTQAFPVAQIPDEIQGHVLTACITKDRAYAVTDDGKLHAWGNQIQNAEVADPTDLDGQIQQLVAGENHVVALLKDGSLRAWGSNENSQLNGIPKGKFTKLYAGFQNTYAVSEDGTLKGFGPKGYLFGTDDYGRDVFRRLLLGGRMTMTVGAIAVIISALIGILIGGISGFYSGPVDIFLMRFAEVINSIPFLPLAMILSNLLGSRLSEMQRIMLIMVILGILSWPSLARLTRAQILSERKKEFVTAAQALGIPERKIIFKHIVPNVINVILVNITLGFATCMLTESALSFLGFGVQAPQPTWGNMLNGAQNSLVIGTYWWRWVFPSLILAICTISINSLGDGLRDAIDPKSNGR